MESALDAEIRGCDMLMDCGLTDVWRVAVLGGWWWCGSPCRLHVSVSVSHASVCLSWASAPGEVGSFAAPVVRAAWVCGAKF